MRLNVRRAVFLVLAAALLFFLSAPGARAENVFDSIKEKVMEAIGKEMEKRNPPQTPESEDAETASGTPPAPAGGGGGLNKVLVWGDPQHGFYYREGQALYGKADGGRCMTEKQAKQNGLKAAQGMPSGNQGQAAPEDDF